MLKHVYLLLLLALPGTCSSDVEDEGVETVAYVPQDSLDHWSMRSPPHIVDLAMWFFQKGDSSGVVPWDRLLTTDGPIQWREKKPQHGKGGWKGVSFLNGSCTIALKGKNGGPKTAMAFLLVKGDEHGAKQIGLNSGYDLEWGGRAFEPALWMDVDTARYAVIDEWDNEMDGKTFHYTYKLDLPRCRSLRVSSGNSCGTSGCNYEIGFATYETQPTDTQVH